MRKEFAGPKGRKFFAYVSPEEDANVTFDMVGNPNGAFTALGDMSTPEVRQVLNGVLATLRDDIGLHGRQSYEMFSGNAKKARLYQRLARREGAPDGYFFDFESPENMLLRKWPEY